MTSTPVSLNDESLNGSWIDINSASQIHSPIEDDLPKYLRPPYSLAESVQNLGFVPFQVERFLQEANRNTSNQNVGDLIQNASGTSNNNGQQQQQIDNISDMYLSDSDVSVDVDLQGNRSTMLDNLRKHYKQSGKHSAGNRHNNDNLNSIDANNQQQLLSQSITPELLSQRLAKSGEMLLDQVSDSLSILSRASLSEVTTGHTDQAANFQDFDWLWDWTAQPEYFTGQEWKVSAPKQDYLLRQRKIYCSANLSAKREAARQQQGDNLLSGEMMSLLFLTNILSIIIGAGLTYSVLMQRSNV